MRRSRFRRQNPPPFQPTEDDRTIVRHIAEHRFLRSGHIVRLLARSRDKVLRRLSVLFHNAVLDRPRAQRLAFGGNAEMVYALGPKASQLFGAPDGIDWAHKNRTVKTPYIAHALMTANFMVAVECALRRHPHIRLLRASDIVEDVRRATGLDHHAWTLSARVPGVAGEVAATPDKVFGLEFADSGRRNYFLVEVDRSTMPIARASLETSSFQKKILAYHFAHRSKRHSALWGIPGFRVLTLAHSSERIASMIATVKTVTGGTGSNVFLFAIDAEILAGDPLMLAWQTGKGGSARLMA